MGFIQEFRDFAIKGNVFDMAIGVIMGGAFGKIVGSLIENVLNPIIGKVAGNVDFTNRYINISGVTLADNTSYADAKKAGAMLGYGSFISDVINFLILAWIIFLMVKAVNNMRRRLAAEKPAAPSAPPADVLLLTEIRDLLARK